jgi:hypothetical protein
VQSKIGVLCGKFITHGNMNFSGLAKLSKPSISGCVGSGFGG